MSRKERIDLSRNSIRRAKIAPQSLLKSVKIGFGRTRSFAVIAHRCLLSAPLAIDQNASADALVLKIKSSSCSFDTSPSALQELKLQRVPDSVILAVLQAPKPLMRTAATTAPEIVAKPSSVAHELIANGTIAAGSKVFIEPMDGFESFLAAALEKKKVPVVVVSDPQLAEFTIG